MARIKIKDLAKDAKVTPKDIDKVRGGSLTQPGLFTAAESSRLSPGGAGMRPDSFGWLWYVGPDREAK